MAVEGQEPRGGAAVVREADGLYRTFLESDPEGAFRERKRLDGRLLQRGCIYSGGPIPTFMKPQFISREQEGEIARACRLLLRAVEKVTDLYFTSEEFAREVNLTPRERELMEIDPGSRRKVVVARLDGFLDGGSLKFLEFNTDSPAGLADGDILEEEFLRLGAMAKLSGTFRLDLSEMKERYIEVLLDAYGEWGGKGNPNIAIVDWDHVKNRTEFYRLAEFFESRGLPSRVGDPRALKLKRGKLQLDGFPVDLVVRRVIVRELAEAWEEVQDFVRAAREGGVCVLNPFRSKIAGFKGILSILSDARYRSIFDAEELDVIDRTIPWTRTITGEGVEYRGETENTLDLLLRKREELILKPLHGYGGEDVHLGPLTPPAEWEATARRALRGGFIVQEYVPIPESAYPVFEPNLAFRMKKENINPFSLAGSYAGCITRVSDSAIINLTKGGGQIPAFTVRSGS